MLFFGVWMAVLAFGKRLKWRGRDLLELAAQPVDETAAIGFTDRPRLVGKVDTTERELAAFADFCRRNLIAVPYVESNRVVLALVMEGQDAGFVLGFHQDYAADTWVAFDYEGNVPPTSLGAIIYVIVTNSPSISCACRSVRFSSTSLASSRRGTVSGSLTG
jgi:hypothetical protein